MDRKDHKIAGEDGRKWSRASSADAGGRFFALDGCVTGDGSSAADFPEDVYLNRFGRRNFGAIRPLRSGKLTPSPPASA
ncbi:MAG: hypothetical protein ACRDG3_00055 [Tepidiformaceae bacterium]